MGGFWCAALAVHVFGLSSGVFHLHVARYRASCKLCLRLLSLAVWIVAQSVQRCLDAPKGARARYVDGLVSRCQLARSREVVAAAVLGMFEEEEESLPFQAGKRGREQANDAASSGGLSSRSARSRGAAASSSGRASGASPGQSPGVPVCLMPLCDDLRKKGSRFCQRHDRHFQNRRYDKEHNK
eukprot:676534-Alexandrium_andersonii.AAC.1